MKTRLSLLLGLLALLPACKREQPGDPTAPPTPIEDVHSAGADPHQAETLVGLSLEEAAALAESASIPHRIVEVDGQVQPTTMDFRPERLNFTVEKGRIVKVTKG